jgi:hypothetical protein
MVYIKSKSPNLGIFWRAIEWKHLAQIMYIWYNVWPLGIVCGPLVYFYRYGMFDQRKIWQPCLRAMYLAPSIWSFWGVSDPMCLSSSSALHFFQLFFLCPPPFNPEWLATPCTCNDLWLLSHVAIFSKRTIGFSLRMIKPDANHLVLSGAARRPRRPPKFWRSTLTRSATPTSRPTENCLPRAEPTSRRERFINSRWNYFWFRNALGYQSRCPGESVL